MNVKDASDRLARWALLLQQYDFEIVHCPGKTHGNADGLSRLPYVSRDFNSPFAAPFPFAPGLFIPFFP